MKKTKTIKRKPGRPKSNNIRIHYNLTPIVVEAINAQSKKEGFGVSVVADRALRIGLGIDQ